MPIVSADIKCYLSGGASNTDVNASIGGAKSTTEFTTGNLHNLFDLVDGVEGSAGDIEYRCLYVENTHSTLTLQDAALFIPTNTPSTDTSADVGLGAAAIDATETAIADEDTAPSGVTFSAPTTLATGLSIGDLAPGEHKAFWIRRTVNAGASAYNNDDVTWTVSGNTAA